VDKLHAKPMAADDAVRRAPAHLRHQDEGNEQERARDDIVPGIVSYTYHAL
jgi:hypothetical protein